MISATIVAFAFEIALLGISDSFVDCPGVPCPYFAFVDLGPPKLPLQMYFPAPALHSLVCFAF